MSDELERRWDDAVETAWREFRQRLADRIAELDPDEEVAVDTGPGDEAAPWCQVALSEDSLWVSAMSDGETDLVVELEPHEVDRAAVMVVEALRETYGVIHPIYLDAEGLEPAREGGKPLPPKPRLPRVVAPTSADDVRAAVDRAVADLYEDTPEWDDDGDLPLPTDERVVWISVAKTAPRILISCVLIEDVDDGEALLGEINRLNAAEFGLTFLWRGRFVSVLREVPLDAVVPKTLAGDLSRIVSQVDGWAADLRRAQREAARPRLGEQGGRFRTAYAVLAELEREERGSVGAIAILRIFDNDTTLLLKAIRITEQKRRDARGKAHAAAAGGRRTKEKVEKARHDYLRDLTSRLRAALRMVVDAPVRKPQLDQLALFDEDEAGTGR